MSFIKDAQEYGFDETDDKELGEVTLLDDIAELLNNPFDVLGDNIDDMDSTQIESCYDTSESIVDTYDAHEENLGDL